MSSNKQTAVEWLEDKFDKFLAYYEGHHKAEPYSIVELSNDFFKAKEMEKQQKMQCWETAHQAGRFEGKGIAIENWQTFEQYYNEEYGK